MEILGLKNAITKIKSLVDRLQSRMEGTEGEKISELEDRIIEITQSEKQKENRGGKKPQSLRDLWDHDKTANIHIIEVPEGEEKEDRYEKEVKEIIAENS